MGRYDFNTVTSRKGTGSLKYDFARERAGREDLLPMWVADMDFALPEEILFKIRERLDHGIFGYTEPDERYYQILKNWFAKHYHYQIREEWNTVVPGVVYGLAAAIRAVSEPGDAVIIQEPVYYPFRSMITANGRICVNNQLLLENGRYIIDFPDFEKKIEENHVKAFLLCSPHNPVGRVWSKEELHRLFQICLDHQVVVIADEIHCDFIYQGKTFTSAGTLENDFRDQLILCTSPSKTFNMAGLQVANILIPDPKLRHSFRRENSANGYSQSNTLGLTAAAAAYEYGEEWLSELLQYLSGNLDLFRSFLERELPDLKLIEPEGTYLLWVDFSGMFEEDQTLRRFIREEAKLWLDDGVIFGETARFFERFNIACPGPVLLRALEQLKSATGRLRFRDNNTAAPSGTTHS